MRPGLQAVFLTGQSDPGRCALSPEQAAFLAALPLPAPARGAHNFPYLDVSRPYRAIPLPLASWNNVRQFVGAHAPAFRRRHRDRVLARLDEADRTLLLAGSSGLSLLRNLGLPEGALRRLHVFAYGAVGWSRPPCDAWIVTGRRDWIAACLGPKPDVRVDCGHMDYLSCAGVLEACHDYLARILPGQRGHA